MFPSSRLFAGITCPVTRRGRCERPHCFYGHAAAEDGSHATVVDLTGEDSDGPPAAGGAQVTPEVSDQHLHELERLNKEIESVKQEVEQEQRRLSNYTAAGSGAPAHQNRGFYGLQSSADQKNPVQTRKYLVDNSRPRTDLEYDPLSNFSAALRSYSSSGKKSKKLECRSSKAEESAPQQVQTCGFLEDAREDGVLVIDEVPEDPSARVQKHVGGKPPLCVQENVKMSTALHSSLRTPQETGPSLICGAAALWSSDPNVQNRSQVAPEQPGGAEKPDLQQRQTPERSSAPPPPPQKPPPVGPQENPPPTSTVSPSEDSRSRAEPSGDRTVIEINSSPEDEEDSSYLDVELSDSDPMEECYRIFMEANDQQHLQEQEDDTEKLQTNAGLEASAGKKRVAHDAKNSEQPQAKSRPQPQVLVPLREQTAPAFGPRASKIQQVQQRASMLTASVKAGRAFASAMSQRSQEETRAAAVWTPPPAHLQPAPLQNTYMNYIPVGTAVIEVGNNLHLILPQRAFPLPVASTSTPLPSVLTPVAQVHPQTNHPAAVIPVARSRSAAPAAVVVPPARRPALAAASLPSAAPQTTSKPSKRKLKQQSEASKEKVPHNVRQRYVNMFTEEFLKSTHDVNEAFQKALSEEKSVFNRSANKLKYLSVAVNALKRLKNQSAAASKSEKDVSSRRSKGNIPLSLMSCRGKDDSPIYNSLKDYVLSDERMIENNYPVQHPEKPGCAVLFNEKKTNPDPLKRICCRCGSTYSVSQSGKHVRKEECNYHYGKGVENRVPGGVETRYSCCQGVMGAPACQLFKLHVHDSLSMEGFVSTAGGTPSDAACPGVYSLDCEMCYTVHGLELSRVTVIGSDLQVVYDAFVKPDSEVIDYNTRFSGISEKDVSGTSTSLKEVQQTLLQFITADTILIGHGLETDLCLLKLLHGKVVDTAVVFPHRLGPPHKLSLNQLTAEHLRRIIQESGGFVGGAAGGRSPFLTSQFNKDIWSFRIIREAEQVKLRHCLPSLQFVATTLQKTQLPAWS
ncbi:RNA exonuclease 1 homolog isoform X2 [Oryzias melastigma]|uniref:RNA exonuclease 1 homolog isoform X2 n=1 Tax=Oryzias melastigma TaxID=30732 RepID=UPI000CF82F7F|nr:RNA exonuclease 1 homolog isoform X2 [Oryzias melastigma]